MESIYLEFEYTEAEAVRSVVELTRCANKSIVMLPWIGGLVIVMTLVFALTGGENLFDFSALLLFGLLLASTPLLTLWTAKRDFRKNPGANKAIRWEINDEWLRNETIGTEARFVWEKLIKVVERKSGFLLFPQRRLAYWIPKRAFRGDKEMDEFRNSVRKHHIELQG